MRNLCKKIKNEVDDLLEWGTSTKLKFIMTSFILIILSSFVGVIIGLAILYIIRQLTR